MEISKTVIGAKNNVLPGPNLGRKRLCEYEIQRRMYYSFGGSESSYVGSLSGMGIRVGNSVIACFY